MTDKTYPSYWDAMRELWPDRVTVAEYVVRHEHRLAAPAPAPVLHVMVHRDPPQEPTEDERTKILDRANQVLRQQERPRRRRVIAIEPDAVEHTADAADQTSMFPAVQVDEVEVP